MLDRAIMALPREAKLLDFGCFGWTLHKRASALRADLSHYGCDAYAPHDTPDQAVFFAVDAESRRVPCDDDFFDLVVASHVLEHVSDPLAFFAELGRICKPGGAIYVETPSDRSVLVKSDGDVESHSFFSFWDDPTHLKPWSPAALYRLAISYGFRPRDVGYFGGVMDKLLLPLHTVKAWMTGERHRLTDAVWRANKFACGMVAEKPAGTSGEPEYVYLSLRDIPRGTEAALAFRNSRTAPGDG